MNGIDISAFQEGIDLSAVPADFVIVKVSQGTGYVNPYFETQAKQTVDAGKLLGLYHYADGTGAEAEAQYFLDNAKQYINKAVLFLDWETGESKYSYNSQFSNVNYAKQFLDYVYNKTGTKPLIYMSKGVCRQFDWTSVANIYDLWVAQYANNVSTGYQAEPWTDSHSYGAWSEPVIFQYSSSGLLEGYGGSLDLNVAYMSELEWLERAGAEEVTGWQRVDGKWKYTKVEHLTSQWAFLDGQWCYFDAEGFAVQDRWTGLKDKDKTYWYHFNKNCYMDTGWYTDSDGNKYLLNTNDENRVIGVPVGAMLTGTVERAGETFYFVTDSSPVGRLFVGWREENGKYVFYNDRFDCELKGAKMYNHFVPSIVDENIKYYVKDDGTMAQDETLIIEGKKVTFDKDGKMM